jgi:hypothetical protein
MSITPLSVIGFVGLLEFVGLKDLQLNKHDKPNEPNKRSLAFHASASVKSFSLSILRFQVEI